MALCHGHESFGVSGTTKCSSNRSSWRKTYWMLFAFLSWEIYQFGVTPLTILTGRTQLTVKRGHVFVFPISHISAVPPPPTTGRIRSSVEETPGCGAEQELVYIGALWRVIVNRSRLTFSTFPGPEITVWAGMSRPWIRATLGGVIRADLFQASFKAFCEAAKNIYLPPLNSTILPSLVLCTLER